jgi:hypothetical protein
MSYKARSYLKTIKKEKKSLVEPGFAGAGSLHNLEALIKKK